jgi:peptidoglycan-associated lipoprotein
MTSKLLPTLCAALLLAACADDPSKPAETPTPQIDTASTDQAVAGPSETDMGNVGNTVYFDTDIASLNSAAQAQLQKEAAWLKEFRQFRVTIEGHADERGTREYNLALGERRAQAVVDDLAALGVDPARLKEISYGKERPICTDSTEACWSQNRRGVTAVDN